MKTLCGFLLLVCFMLLSLSQAERPIKNVLTPHKAVVNLKNVANVSLGTDEESKSIIPSKSEVVYDLDDNSKKMEGLHSPDNLGEMISIDEDEENGNTTQPFGHSPGIGHNSPPGNMP